MAPQHPKKLITKITDPRTTILMGIAAGEFSGKTSRMLSSLNNGIAPTTISAIPATCE